MNQSKKQKRRKEIIKEKNIQKQQGREQRNKDRMPAPQPFLDTKKEVDLIEKTIANILGVELVWFQEQRYKEREEFDKAIQEYTNLKKWPIDKQKKYLAKINTLVEISGVFYKYAWSRFRLDNIDNEFGVAGQLKYDSKKDEIYIPRESKVRKFVKGAGEYLKKVLKEK